jgi:hypothetical protein
MRKPISEAKRAKIIRLANDGSVTTGGEISKLVGVSLSSVARVLKAHRVEEAKNARMRAAIRVPFSPPAPMPIGVMAAEGMHPDYPPAPDMKQPSRYFLTLLEVVSVAAGKKSKEEAFDAIAAIFNVRTP